MESRWCSLAVNKTVGLCLNDLCGLRFELYRQNDLLYIEIIIKHLATFKNSLSVNLKSNFARKEGITRRPLFQSSEYAFHPSTHRTSRGPGSSRRHPCRAACRPTSLPCSSDRRAR
jgi:hypothetical protein